MVSLINKQLLLTAYAYLFIMEQQKAQQGGEALQLQVERKTAKENEEGDPVAEFVRTLPPGVQQIQIRKLDPNTKEVRETFSVAKWLNTFVGVKNVPNLWAKLEKNSVKLEKKELGEIVAALQKQHPKGSGGAPAQQPPNNMEETLQEWTREEADLQAKIVKQKGKVSAELTNRLNECQARIVSITKRLTPAAKKEAEQPKQQAGPKAKLWNQKRQLEDLQQKLSLIEEHDTTNQNLDELPDQIANFKSGLYKAFRQMFDEAWSDQNPKERLRELTKEGLVYADLIAAWEKAEELEEVLAKSSYIDTKKQKVWEAFANCAPEARQQFIEKEAAAAEKAKAEKAEELTLQFEKLLARFPFSKAFFQGYDFNPTEYDFSNDEWTYFQDKWKKAQTLPQMDVVLEEMRFLTDYRVSRKCVRGAVGAFCVFHGDGPGDCCKVCGTWEFGDAFYNEEREGLPKRTWDNHLTGKKKEGPTAGL